MKKFMRYRAEDSPQAWLFLLPSLLIIAIFNIYPLYQTFKLSLYKGSLNNLTFNGFQNFQVVLQDPKFHTALSNTATYAFV
ncbi:MAG: sugar ABC transporter permease, partial [Culicoidibacterales bacterium]